MPGTLSSRAHACASPLRPSPPPAPRRGACVRRICTHTQARAAPTGQAEADWLGATRGRRSTAAAPPRAARPGPWCPRGAGARGERTRRRRQRRLLPAGPDSEPSHHDPASGPPRAPPTVTPQPRALPLLPVQTSSTDMLHLNQLYLLSNTDNSLMHA
jgi:hypothetical protein